MQTWYHGRMQQLNQSVKVFSCCQLSRGIFGPRTPDHLTAFIKVPPLILNGHRKRFKSEVLNSKHHISSGVSLFLSDQIRFWPITLAATLSKFGRHVKTTFNLTALIYTGWHFSGGQDLLLVDPFSDALRLYRIRNLL